jgi:hypothetical protein
MFFPDTYTLDECLNIMRVFFPVGLTLMIVSLDFTLDRLPENDDDPTIVLRTIVEKQQKYKKEAEELYDIMKKITDVEDE